MPLKKLNSLLIILFLKIIEKFYFSSPYIVKRKPGRILSKKLQHNFITKDFLNENGKIKRSLTIFRNCPICDKNDTSIFFDTFDGLRYVKCKNCGMIYTTRILTPDAYNDYQMKLEQSEKSWSSERTIGKQDDRNRFMRYIKIIKKYRKKGKLLDIGCFTGNFLEFAISSGYLASGVEIHPEKVEIAKKRGFNVTCGNFEECTFKQKFNIITLWESFEHMNNPKIVIEKIGEVLDQSGIICFTVPNGASLNGKILTGHKIDYTGIGHKNLFTPSAIKYLLEKNGFEILKLTSEGNRLDAVNISHYFAGNFQNTDSFHNWENLKEIKYDTTAKWIMLLNFLAFEPIIERYKLGNILFVIAEKIN